MKFLRQRRYRVAIAVVGLIGLIWGGTYYTRPPDPLYQGKRLSVHLYGLTYYPGFSPAEAREYDVNVVRAKAALLEKRREALPLLQNWLETKPNRVREIFSRFLVRNRVMWPALAADRQSLSLTALKEIPEESVALVPEIILALEEGSTQVKRQAAELLTLILKKAPPPERSRVVDQIRPVAAELLENTDIMSIALRPYRYQEILGLYRNLPLRQRESAVERYLTNRNLAVLDRLVAGVLDEDGIVYAIRQMETDEISSKMSAATFFQGHPVHAERIVPLLIKCLGSTNRPLVAAAAETLGAYGRDATSAIEPLTRLSTHSDEPIARATRAAVASIRRERGLRESDSREK